MAAPLLITVLGAVCALLGLTFGGWVVGLGALAVAALLVVGNLAQGKAEEVEPGVTTEIVALLMYGYARRASQNPEGPLAVPVKVSGACGMGTDMCLFARPQ